MFYPQFVHILAPQTPVGWVLRIPVFLMGVLGLSLMPDLLLQGQATQSAAGHFRDVVWLGVPLGLALLLAVKKLHKAETQIASITQIDAITGVANHRTFLQRMTRALPQSGVLLMLDLDHFKRVNDMRGRHAGDLCLMALAQRCREITRNTDIIGRLDGAVFAIYLPGAPVERGREIADQLSEGIQVMTARGVLTATVSVGAVIADGWTPLDQLMRNADQALDRAKLQGRARVILRELPTAA